MKRISLVLGALTVLVFSSSAAFADCETDCDGPFQTCLNICRQTTKEDSAEAAKCADSCLRGVSGCIKRCRANQSGIPGNCTAAYSPAAGDFVAFNTTPAASCIEEGLTCILNGTPCCAPYECKGKFPNTTCQ
jgi:hypothetical protein